MARTMTSVSVGRVNRRLLFFALALAVLSAVLVYAATSRSGGGGAPAESVSVVVAKQPIAAGTRITAELLAIQQVPASAVGAQPLASVDEAVGKVARYPIAANEQVLLSKVVGSSAEVSNDVLANVLEAGRRALAITTSGVVGAGGLVLPGDRVDLLWVPDKLETNEQGAVLLAENIEVLAVQQTLVDIAPTAPGAQTAEGQPAQEAAADERVRGSDADAIPDASTVTLMVAPEQAQLVFCAEEYGTLRLAVRAFGDSALRGVAPVSCPVSGEQPG